MSGEDPRPGLSVRHRRVLLAAGLCVSAVFLWLVARDSDAGRVWAALRGADLPELALAALVVELVYVVQALRWRLLSGLSTVSAGRFLALVLAGIATNNVLPLRVGDLMRGRWLATSARVGTGRALGSVFRDRLGDVAVLVAGLAVCVPLVGSAAWVGRVVAGGGILLAACSVATGAALLYVRRRPRERLGERGRLRGLARDLLEEVASPLGRRRIAVALLLSAVAWGLWACAARLVCASLGIDVSVPEIVFVTCVVNLGVAIPSSPGFVGTYQWLGVSALAVAGVDGDVALAFALLMQAIWFVPTTLVGGPIALREASNDPIGRGPTG